MSDSEKSSTISYHGKQTRKKEDKKSNYLTYGVTLATLILSVVTLLYLHQKSKREKRKEKQEANSTMAGRIIEAEPIALNDKVELLNREVVGIKRYISDFFQQPSESFYQVQTPIAEEEETSSTSSESSSASSESYKEEKEEEPALCTVRLTTGKRKGNICQKKCPPGSNVCGIHTTAAKVQEVSLEEP